MCIRVGYCVEVVIHIEVLYTDPAVEKSRNHISKSNSEGTMGTVLTWQQNKLFSTETCRSHALDKGWSLRGIVGYIIAKYNQFVVTAKCSCLLTGAFSNVLKCFF